ncbi:MAG: hypothetical protein ACXIVG_02745 [Pararhodobacter sp.]
MMSPVSFSMFGLTHDLQKRGAGMRQALTRHVQELTSGQVAAPQRHLKGDLAPLAAMEHRTTRLQAETRTLAQAESRLSAVQASIGAIMDRQDTLAQHLRQAVSAWSLPGTDQLAGQAGFGSLADMTQTLRQNIAGQHLFAGNRSDTPPLPSAETILDAAQDAVAGLVTVEDVTAALQQFFHDPMGGFDNLLYQGGDPLPGQADGAAPLPTAADTALRQQLMGATMAALLSAPTALADPVQRRALAALAIDSLDAGQVQSTALAARVGLDQGALAVQQRRLQAESDALQQARATLIGADPFVAAAQLEDTRVQLELLYSVTARVSRLSFADYMR